MKRYLRKLKYEFTSYKSEPKNIPTHFDQGTWKENTSILNLFSNADFDLLTDLKLDEMKIFGKVNKSWILNTDFFNDYNFKNKKLKPAYFNTADVKVPYEASRLQYLQKQNISSMFTKEVKLDDSLFNIDVHEFPPIYWNSPMDVAIRTINLIIHRQFVSKRLHKSQILNNDEKLIDTFISQHFQYIKNNLENDGNVVGNHYLIELSAMLFYLANYKNSNYENDLEFTLDELKKELTHQFNNEGTNFEGSSHYAAFVTEALVLCKLSLEDIDKNHEIVQLLNRLIVINKTFLELLINNEELSQIGDNDSGRIFYFAFNEDKPLQMTWLIRLIESLDLNKKTEFNDLRYQIEIKKETHNFLEYKGIKHPEIKVFSQDYKAYAFTEFGIYIWRNKEEYFSIRCGPIGQNGIGGHSHYDQLSIECFTNQQWIARDPGTGTYTDDMSTRNSFKSLQYHWGPNINLKFKQEDEFDCFKLNNMSDGKALIFNHDNFLGVANFNGKKIYRKLSINDGIITIEDYSKMKNLKKYESWGESTNGIKVKFSEGYKRFS
jgi:hypothetical protein